LPVRELRQCLLLLLLLELKININVDIYFHSWWAWKTPQNLWWAWKTPPLPPNVSRQT
jgi:hypothetical protein